MCRYLCNIQCVSKVPPLHPKFLRDGKSIYLKARCFQQCKKKKIAIGKKGQTIFVTVHFVLLQNIYILVYFCWLIFKQHLRSCSILYTRVSDHIRSPELYLKYIASVHKLWGHELELPYFLKRDYSFL